MTPPTFEQLSRPLPPLSPRRWYYAGVHGLLKALSPLSEGLSIGFKHGFDSGVMLEHVYQNTPRGKGAFGRFIDKTYLNAPGWRGIRARGDLVKSALRAALHQHGQGGSLRLLDVACGGGRYDLEVLRDYQEANPQVKVDAILRDYAQVNVDSAQALGTKLGVKGVRYERADAFSDADLARAASEGLFDIVIVSGLHEILSDDALIHHHYAQLEKVLKPGGTLIFTVQPTHPQLEFIARVLPSHTKNMWVMRLRSREQVEGWAQEAGLTPETRWNEPLGIFGVVLAKKAG